MSRSKPSRSRVSLQIICASPSSLLISPCCDSWLPQKSDAVQPTALRAVGSAPRHKSSCTHSTCPCFAASMRGVRPIGSLNSNSAPLSSSLHSSCLSPLLAASQALMGAATCTCVETSTAAAAIHNLKQEGSLRLGAIVGCSWTLALECRGTAKKQRKNSDVKGCTACGKLGVLQQSVSRHETAHVVSCRADRTECALRSCCANSDSNCKAMAKHDDQNCKGPRAAVHHRSKVVLASETTPAGLILRGLPLKAKGSWEDLICQVSVWAYLSLK